MNGQADESTTDPGLATVEWLARHHDRAFTPDAARARLSRDADTNDPAVLSQALEAAGLAAHLVHRRPDKIDPATLPAVLFGFDGSPLLLTDLTRRGARIVDPARDGLTSEVTLAELRSRVRHEALLVTRQAPTGDTPDKARHWFWGPMRSTRWGWAQIALSAFAINVLGLALPIFVMNTYDRVIPNLAFVTLWTLAAGVAIAILLDLALRSLRAAVLERIGRRLDIAVSSKLFRHALSLRPADLPGGALGTATFLRDFETVREFFGSMSLVALIDLVFVGIFITVLWLIVGPLAFVPMVAVPVMLALAVAAQLPMGSAVEQAQAAGNRRHKVLVEALAGLETVKSLNAEPVMQREWDMATAASARVTGKSRFWANTAAHGTMVIQQAVSVTLIVWGVFLIADGKISMGALIAANILSGRALAPLGAIAQTVFRARYARRAMTSLGALMAVAPERPVEITSPGQVRRGDLETRGVTFTYPGSEIPAISDLSLTVGAGETLALVGRVGSGKSTLGKLLSGLLAADHGTILVDGQNLSQFDPTELRHGVGYLPQDPELFTGTLRDNLLIATPRADEADISRALATAGIDSFVAGLGKGLDTFIGERGSHLSGGQRQGLALARLLIAQPRVLFLDEPTNAMDRDMEMQVTGELAKLAGQGVTLILCTHRPALAGIAGRMVLIDKGRKVLDGPRDDVLGRLQQAALAQQSGKGVQ